MLSNRVCSWDLLTEICQQFKVPKNRLASIIQRLVFTGTRRETASNIRHSNAIVLSIICMECYWKTHSNYLKFDKLPFRAIIASQPASKYSRSEERRAGEDCER